MTDAFQDLKKKAEAAYTADKLATESWAKANRGWLIAIVVALVSGAVLVKACTG